VVEEFLDPSDVEAFAEAPLLTPLRILAFRNCGWGVEGFLPLVSSPHLANLVALRLPNNYIGNGGIEGISSSTSFPSLQELDLSLSGPHGYYFEDPIIDQTGLAALAQWRGLARLRSLNLSGHAAGQSGLRSLLQSKHLSQLKELILCQNDGFGPEAMQEFAAARTELQLEVLDLGLNVLRNAGAGELAKAPCLRDLKVLNLARCEIHTAGARQLAEAECVGNLRELNVNDNSIGPDGLLALLEANPAQLHTLHIRNNDLSDEGVSHLAASTAAETLQELDLSQNGLTAKTAKALAKSKHLKSLLHLRLNTNHIDKAAQTALKRSFLGKRLSVLELEKQK
jgi:Leucine-rich repeat (LRR) protein